MYVERNRRIERVADRLFEGEEAVLHVIDRIVAPLGLRVDATSPWVDARLPDGSRVQTDFLAPLSYDPANCAPTPRTRYRCQRSGTPFSSCSPASSNVSPEPATRSFTVCETRTSEAPARAPTRAPMCTASPPTLSPIDSTSPVCRPARISIPSARTASMIAWRT